MTLDVATNRVRFATNNNDDGLEWSGFNGYPCEVSRTVIPESVITPSFFPIETRRGFLDIMFWRVRTWRVTVSGDYNHTFDLPHNRTAPLDLLSSDLHWQLTTEDFAANIYLCNSFGTDAYGGAVSARILRGPSTDESESAFYFLPAFQASYIRIAGTDGYLTSTEGTYQAGTCRIRFRSPIGTGTLTTVSAGQKTDIALYGRKKRRLIGRNGADRGENLDAQGFRLRGVLLIEGFRRPAHASPARGLVLPVLRVAVFRRGLARLNLLGSVGSRR